MSISLRIKELRQQKKLNQVQFSKHLGVSQASVSQYESGSRTPDSSFLAKVCETYQVNLNWLLTGSGDMFNSTRAREADPHLIDIPVASSIAAGSPIQVYEDEPLEILQIPAAILPLPPPYFAFRVEGESMAPFILDGDIVILSRDWRGLKLNNRICGFRTQDGITLKKMVIQPKQKTTWLMPLNHTYEPIPYNRDTEDLIFFGVLCLSLRYYT
mgnify:CR=1 FL=1